MMKRTPLKRKTPLRAKRPTPRTHKTVVRLTGKSLDRSCIGIELSKDYAEMSRSRILGSAPLLNEVEVSQ